MIQASGFSRRGSPRSVPACFLIVDLLTGRVNLQEVARRRAHPFKDARIGLRKNRQNRQNRDKTGTPKTGTHII